MKKILIPVMAFVFTLAFSVSINAQTKDATRTFKKGQADLNIGVGLLPTYFLDGGTTVFVPVLLSIDAMVGKNFSIGGYASYSVSDSKERTHTILENTHELELIGQWRNTYSEIGVRGAFHYTQRNNLDVYGGISMAYTNIKIEALKDNLEVLEGHLGMKPVTNRVVPSAFIGVKYAFTPRISMFSEAGFTSSLLKMGLSMRLW